MALIGYQHYREEMRHPWLNPARVAIGWNRPLVCSPLTDLSAVWVAARHMADVHLDRVRLTQRAFEWFVSSEQFRRRFKIVHGRDWEGTERERITSLPEIVSTVKLTLGPDCRIEIVPECSRDWDPACEVEMTGIRDFVKHYATLRIA